MGSEPFIDEYIHGLPFLFVRHPMNRSSKSSFNFPLLLIIAMAVVISVVIGTVAPWTVATEKLRAIGPGPYVPFHYSYSSGGTNTYRSQTYIIVSQLGKSLSAYRVEEKNGSATIEEVPYGVLYATVFFSVLVGGAIWAFRRLRTGPPLKLNVRQ